MNLYYRLGWLLSKAYGGLYLGLRASGLENVPRTGSAIIASNHKSMLDPPLIGSTLKRDIFFFAKSELFGKWWSGIFIEHFNTIPVKRSSFDRHAYAAGLEALNNDNLLLVFPEGTRSKDGKLGEGKAGAARMASDADVPVIPVAIINSEGSKPFFLGGKRVRVRFGNPIRSSDYEEVADHKQRIRTMTGDIMTSIKTLIAECEREANL